MDEISMPTLFIDGTARQSQNERAKKFAGSQKSFIGLQCGKKW
jgi:hypothetical protein